MRAINLALGTTLSTLLTSGRRGVATLSAASATNLPPLLNSNGAAIDNPSDALAGKRVAYYFSAGWCPMCTRFEPSLLQFCEAAKIADKPVEIIYVASDRSSKDSMARAKKMGFNQVPFDDECSQLKKRFNIWAGSESMKFGFGRRSGVPALVTLSEDGEEISFIDAESSGPGSLAKWDLDTGVWGKA